MLKCVAALAAAGALAGGAARAAPLEAYGGLPAVAGIAISPSGEQVATIQTDHERRIVHVENVADHKTKRIVQVGAAKPHSLVWAGEDHLIIVASATTETGNPNAPRGEYSEAFDLDLRNGGITPLLADVRFGEKVVTSNPMPRRVDGKLALFVPGLYFWHRDEPARKSLFRVDLDDHSTRLAWAGFPQTNSFVIDDSGKVVAESEYDARFGQWTLKARQGEGWRTVMTVDAKLDPPELLGLGRHPGTVVVREKTSIGIAFREVSVDHDISSERGDGAQSIEKLDAGAQPIWGQDHRLIGTVTRVDGGLRHTFYDADQVRIWKAIETAFPAQEISIVSTTDLPGRLVICVDSPTEGPAFSRVDIAARSAVWIGAEYPLLAPADIAQVKAIRFKTADGLDIGGFLTLPSGRESRGLPLVVMPHDGPGGFDKAGFNWKAQALASRGYAVLQVNYRGSGPERELTEAGYGQWGGKTETDLSDGVRFLVTQGVVDPAKVCIVGVGFGGYDALLGAELEPGTYRCVASIGAPGAFRQWLSGRSDFARHLWARYIGMEQLSESVVSRISPADQASKIMAPVLLVHGSDDSVVPLEQSQLMADALGRAGKSVQLEILQGEDHELSHAETRFQMLKVLVAFVEKNNPPK